MTTSRSWLAECGVGNNRGGLSHCRATRASWECWGQSGEPCGWLGAAPGQACWYDVVSTQMLPLNLWGECFLTSPWCATLACHSLRAKWTVLVGISLCCVYEGKDHKRVNKNDVCMWSVKSQTEFLLQCLSALRVRQCDGKMSSNLLLLLLCSPVSVSGTSGDTEVS